MKGWHTITGDRPAICSLCKVERATGQRGWRYGLKLFGEELRMVTLCNVCRKKAGIQ